ncbi:MAG: hypothetical protein PHO70_06135 [Candidatus Omnitrophica bacterium]|nr:hypothetical protein [Candidatus Omnitrophota bacterium]
MKKNSLFVLGLVIFFLASGISFALAQEQGGAVVPSQIEPEIQWIYGDVVTLDAQNKAMTIKYLDYESNQEKEIGIVVDDKTTFENVKTFDEIKPKDTVSVDYLANPDGKNIAKNINVEKVDASMQKEAPVETTPQALPQETVKPEAASPVAPDSTQQ